MPKKNPSNIEVARKIADKLGLPSARPVKVKMLHTKAVREFVEKVERAHKDAGKSKLTFP